MANLREFPVNTLRETSHAVRAGELMLGDVITSTHSSRAPVVMAGAI